MRDSLIFYRSFYEAVKELPPDMQAQVYNAIFEYSLNFSVVELIGLPKTIFTLIKPQLDANNKRYLNGTKGGKPKAENNQSVTEQKPKRNQSVTITEPNKNVNVNVNVNDVLLEKEPKGEESFKNQNSDSLQTEISKEKSCAKKESFSKPTPEEIQTYCTERGNGISGTEFYDFYESKGWMIGKNKMKSWQAAVRTWEQARKNKNHGNSNQSNTSKISGTAALLNGSEYFEFT